MGFKPGSSKPPGSGIKKGQKQTKSLIRQQVRDMLAQVGTHPVAEIMKLLPEVPPREQLRAWIDLLAYCEPKLSAQAITLDDARDAEVGDEIDVTPLTDEELINAVKEE